MNKAKVVVGDARCLKTSAIISHVTLYIIVIK